MMLERHISGGADSPIPEWLIETLRSLQPVCQQAGLITLDDSALDHLAIVLKRQMTEKDSVCDGASYVCAWTTTRS